MTVDSMADAIVRSTDLFGGSPLAGLGTGGAIISPIEAASLIALIDETDPTPFRFQGWFGKRLTKSYGTSYDFDAARLKLAAPIPDWLMPVRTRAAGFAGLDEAYLTQALLIRYDSGTGIGWHRDRSYYEHVIGISLGAAATMRFRRRAAKGFDRFAVSLPPRSIYRLSGEARHAWKHSVAPMDATRWSITFRSRLPSGLAALRRALPAVRVE